LRLTGFKTYRELMTETTPEQRQMLFTSVEQWHKEREGSMGGLL